MYLLASRCVTAATDFLTQARTMYAEDKRFFPDDLPATLAAADKLWLGYSAKDRQNPNPIPNPNPT